MDEADVLRAKACWRWIHHRSGFGNAEIEELLTPGSVHRLGSKIERPRKWDRYEKGEMCPSDDGTPHGTVGSAEAHFPGFRAFYQHPFWQSISRKEIDAEGVTALMRSLPSLETLLFQLTPITRSFGDPFMPTVPPRRRAFDDNVFQLLRDGQSLDRLAAFLLMVREATIIGSPDYRSLALQGYRRQTPWLRNDPVFSPIATELTDLVDHRFMNHVFAYPNQRFNLYIVTKNMTDEELK